MTIMEQFADIKERTRRLEDLLSEDTSIVEDTQCDICGGFSGEHNEIDQDEYSEGQLIGVGTLSRTCPNK